MFDWDNTIIRNDIGDATLFWALRNEKILQPPGRDWRVTSRWLTADAAAALRLACDGAWPGRPLRTAGRDTRCADEIRSVYADQKTTTGRAAFAGWDHRRVEPSYAWAAQLLAGHTRADIRRFAAAARREALRAPVGATQTVGSGNVNAWVRYYPQQRDLIRALRKAGFDIWIVSASPQPVVRVWALGAGVPPSRVIGVRSVYRSGRQTYRLQGCGGERAGVITYVDGKRCWINQVVYGQRGPAAWDQQPAARRPSFAAGDSTTDVTFLRDATELRLVINRNKQELMCHAYDDVDGRWLINPMFIQPLPQRGSPYPCSSTAFVDSNGDSGPVRRWDGTIIPDQPDTIFGPEER
ncbi:haloacid dehalogenase-like hydrolase [Amycolatopsis cihanbeyliensis]|uniref:haloacid dehalogenase-like hydrolase n=1 Tax=Amycolatopsis cihanbeyliensis TaxID=1128664 RepID=UPI001B884467|nr:haloacid dehalogenase-like hydrolase [Amycolatopsis cihanbeyliensis]